MYKRQVTDDVTDGVDNAADDLTDENGAKKEGDRMKNTDHELCQRTGRTDGQQIYEGI